MQQQPQTNSSYNSSIKTALISVSDKTNLIPLCYALISANVKIYASDGSAKFITEAGLQASRIEELTGQPEMMQGRVKTLHPKVHGGILLRRNLPSDVADALTSGITALDLVVVNLYPFDASLAKIESQMPLETPVESEALNSNTTIKNENLLLNKLRFNSSQHEEMLNQVDIGGVTLLRAAAKNHNDVTVVCNPDDYPELIKTLEQNNTPSSAEKLRLAARAFQHTAEYDATIASYFSLQAGNEKKDCAAKNFWTMEAEEVLRYGENPHEKGALFSIKPTAPLPQNKNEEQTKNQGLSFIGKKILHGKKMSYNNYLDAFEAARTVHEFSENAATVVKHLNPCGLATAHKLSTAIQYALQGDTVSSYGSIVAVNSKLTKSCVDALGKLFIEIIIAPSFSEEALSALKKKSKNLRILQLPTLTKKNTNDVHPPFNMQILGKHVLIKQARPGTNNIEPINWETPSVRKPNESELPLFKFAVQAVKNIKSNAIAIAFTPEEGCNMLLGMGAGQPNRLESLKLAMNKSKENLTRMLGEKNSTNSLETAILASDAFFPFADNIEFACVNGIKKFVHPGGSIRDNEVVAAADRYNAVMMLNKTRFFKH